MSNSSYSHGYPSDFSNPPRYRISHPHLSFFIQQTESNGDALVLAIHNQLRHHIPLESLFKLRIFYSTDNMKTMTQIKLDTPSNRLWQNGTRLTGLHVELYDGKDYGVIFGENGVVSNRFVEDTPSPTTPSS